MKLEPCLILTLFLNFSDSFSYILKFCYYINVLIFLQTLFLYVVKCPLRRVHIARWPYPLNVVLMIQFVVLEVKIVCAISSLKNILHCS